MAANTVTFPAVSRAETPQIISTPSAADDAEHRRHSVVSLVSCHASAVEICDLVYSADASTWGSIARFYEPNAVYENPFVTATSRALLADIHTMGAQLSHIDVPRPLAVLYALLGVKREGMWADPWFRAVKVWNEMGDVCESESLSFDGHRKVMVEHTLHILLLPGLHSSTQHRPNVGSAQPEAASSRSLSLPSTHIQQVAHHSTLGMDLSLPSPFHLRLPITSRLSFNDAGKITHHRDLWDVKDFIGLVPGVSLAQWVSSRLMAQSIKSAVWLGRSIFSSRPDIVASRHLASDRKHPGDIEEGGVSHSGHPEAVGTPGGRP